MGIWDRFDQDEELTWKELVTFKYAGFIPKTIHLQYATSKNVFHIRERDNKSIDPEIYAVLDEVTSSYVNRMMTVEVIAEMKYNIGSELQRFAAEGRIIF